jgi:hypothetical protein
MSFGYHVIICYLLFYVLIYPSLVVAKTRHAFLVLVKVGLNGLAGLYKRGREADWTNEMVTLMLAKMFSSFRVVDYLELMILLTVIGS